MNTDLPKDGKIKASVVICGHPYDVAGFTELFRSLQNVDWYVQDLDTWATSPINDQYDVFIFYHMIAWGTLSVRSDWDDHIKDAIERIGETSQGYFVWHHALLSFPDNPTYDRICNQDDRTVKNGRFEQLVDLNIHVEDPNHPITKDVEDFSLSGEGFVLPRCGAGSRVLLTHDHPRNVETLAWCHDYRDARVLCWQSGHDAGEWTDSSFRTVFQQGIEWLARRR